jgi:Fe-S oxidoreductase
VQHYVQFIEGLLKEGRVAFRGGPDVVAYHDSCYLGRHNSQYDPPRRLAHAAGLRLVEMAPHHMERGLCCGAGGGHMWMEEPRGQRISHLRTEQFLATGAPTVGVSCPFCLQMLSEGIEAKGVADSRQAHDLLELLAERVEPR